MTNSKHSPQRRREYALYRYRKALERGDFDVISMILKQAEHDTVLDQMIAEMDMSELGTPDSGWQDVHPKSFSNGQSPKLNHFQEEKIMTTQIGYWEPTQPTGRSNRLAAAIVLLIAALIVGGVFLFMIPSRTSIMTMVIQQPTQTPAEIAKLYVEELWGKGNKELEKTLLTVDFVDHDPLLINRSRVVTANDKNNSTVFNYNVEILRRAFPDLVVKTEDVVIGSDRIVIRWTFTGTQTARLLDYATTNKSVTIVNTDILRIVDGKIVERWSENKLQTVLDEIGIDTVSETLAVAMTTYARFAEIMNAGKFEELGQVFTDDAVFNKYVTGIAAIQTTVEGRYKELNGINNIRIITAYMVNDHFVAEVEFDTDNSTTHHQEHIEITMKDGKFATYDAT